MIESVNMNKYHKHDLMLSFYKLFSELGVPNAFTDSVLPNVPNSTFFGTETEYSVLFKSTEYRNRMPFFSYSVFGIRFFRYLPNTE